MARITTSIFDQFKAKILSYASEYLGPRLTAWLQQLLAKVEVDNSPHLVIGGEIGDAPDEVKAAILGLIQTALAKIDKPLVRIFLSSLVNNVLSKFIDQAYDAIFGGSKPAAHAEAATGTGLANVTEVADLKACDDQVPPVS